MRRFVPLALMLFTIGCATVAREEAVKREIQAQVDASIDADRRKDLAARMALLTPDYTVTTLTGEVIDRSAAERGIANFHRATVAFLDATHTEIERLELHGDEATVFTNQQLVRTVTVNGKPAERISSIRHRERWIHTTAGWRVKHVEELEQGPVTIDGKPLHIDRAGMEFVRMIRQQGVSAARARFVAARGTPPFEEATLNTAGYNFLGSGRIADAIAIFRLNVDAYPNSANAYDSLAEAYLAVGDKTRAAENYRSTLELAPADERVAAVLARLGTPVGDEDRARMLARMIPDDVELLPNVVYAESTRPLRLHLLRPKAAGAKRAAIVFIHGGGWSEGSKERGLASLIPFVQRGYIAASIEYRLTGEAIFPAQIHDVKCAIRFLRANAEKFGIDPARIVVWGQSAGGHLAALAGTSAGVAELEPSCGTVSSRPDLVIDWNGPTDFLEPRELERLLAQKARDRAPSIAIERLLGGDVTEHREAAIRANPITWVSADDPPFLILHGDADDAVGIEQSRALYNALRAAGVDATLTIFEGERHFGIDPSRPLPPKYIDPMHAFLDRHLQ